MKRHSEIKQFGANVPRGTFFVHNGLFGLVRPCVPKFAL